MRKTRTLAALAAAILAVTLTACGGTATVDEAPPATDKTTAQDAKNEATEAPKPTPTPKPSPTTPPAPELGTRDNPGQPGEHTITFTEGAETAWEVTLGKMDTDAWPEVSAENQFNEPPAEGHVYVMVPVTATYKGSTSGSPWIDLEIAFVAADGRSFDQEFQVIPNAFSDVADLYTGGVGTGNLLFSVPADAVEGGTFAVSYMWGEPMFFAAVPA